MKILTGPVIGLHFLRHKKLVIDTTQVLIRFSNLQVQVKSAASKTSAKPQASLNDKTLTKPPMTTKTITNFDHPSESNTTYALTPLEKVTETASFLVSHSISTTIDKKIVVRVTNTREPFYLIRRSTQVAESSEVTAEQSEVVKPVDTANLSTIPGGDPEQTLYLKDLPLNE